MQNLNLETGITFVDRKSHTIYLNVGGCQITVNCQKESNPTIYETVKDILVDSAFHLTQNTA